MKYSRLNCLILLTEGVMSVECSLEMEVYKLLKNTNRKIKKELHEKLSDNGVTWPQFHALFHISGEGIAFTELARELHCNASNLTGIIDRMIENNCVYREHSEVDRRVWLIKLTEEGAALKAKLVPAHMEDIKDRMNVLTPQELSTLKSLLKKLSSGLNEGE